LNKDNLFSQRSQSMIKAEMGTEQFDPYFVKKVEVKKAD
jgi:hypothetical protein